MIKVASNARTRTFPVSLLGIPTLRVPLQGRQKTPPPPLPKLYVHGSQGKLREPSGEKGRVVDSSTDDKTINSSNNF